MSSYCDVAPGDPWHGPYHDAEYGFPLTGDAELFERLVLEINQAGLSWLTILKKREQFRRAYHGFEVERVARYGARDVRRLLNDAGIIRNRLKVEAAIANAKTILELRESHGGFHQWLLANRPGAEAAPRGMRGSMLPTRALVGRPSGGPPRRQAARPLLAEGAGDALAAETTLPSDDERTHWVRLFRKTFRFTGGEIVNEFLLSTGWIPGAHRESCPVYPRVVKAKPMWARAAGR